MKLPSNHLPQSPRVFLLFPLFSLIFHITLFFLLQALSGGQDQIQMKEEEIIAMVDLESLQLPEALPEEKAPDLVSELKSIPIETKVLPLPTGQDILSEALELPVPEGVGAIEDIGEAVPEAMLSESDALEEESTLSDPALEEALQASEAPVSEPEPVAEEVLSEPESSTEEALALNEEFPEEAPEEPEAPSSPIVDESAPEGNISADTETSSEKSPSEPAPSPSSEVAASDSPVDSTEEQPDEGGLASAEKVIKEAKAAPSSRKKPSKVKIKKVGLLGLLGDGKVSKRGKGRRLLAKNRLGTKRLSSGKDESFPHQSLKATQKVARLSKKVLSSEKKRLMGRKPAVRRRRSGIKIVHGSGRNYGIISAAIQQKKGRLTNVYNRLLQNNENLQGNLIIEFVISPEGSVIKSQVLTSSIGNPSFEKALIREIRRWRFPTVKTGQTTVLYPLSFFPSG